MSEDIPQTGETSAVEAPPAPKVRRISNKNPRKTAKDSADQPQAELDESPTAGTDEELASSDEIRPPLAEDAPVVDNGSPSAEPKRKNRRRRGKGKSKDSDPREDSPAMVEEIIQIAYEEFDSSTENTGKLEKPEQPASPPQSPQQQVARPPQPQQQPQQKPRRRMDPEKVATKAWKIYLAEVSEEGVALIGDNDARELARRCFRLSELFLEEQERRS